MGQKLNPQVKWVSRLMRKGSVSSNLIGMQVEEDGEKEGEVKVEKISDDREGREEKEVANEIGNA